MSALDDAARDYAWSFWAQQDARAKHQANPTADTLNEYERQSAATRSALSTMALVAREMFKVEP